MTKDSTTVAVVVPRRVSRTGSVDSQLMAAAHLARGIARVDPSVRTVLATSEGLADPDGLLRESVRDAADGGTSLLRRMPRRARIFLGDAQAVRHHQRHKKAMIDGPVDLVVQFHHRFQDVGFRIASMNRCPLILRVEALEIEEQRAWGLRGQTDGRLAEAWGENRLFRRADLIATVSESLTDSLQSRGIPRSRVLTLPNGVDSELFAPGPSVTSQDLADLGLEGRFLIGWAGGFRPYHGLGQVEGFVRHLESRVPEATLCLIGTGPMRPQMEQLAARHPRTLRLLGAKPQPEVARWLRSFDVCLQLADPATGDHYSPLKVLEYLACGRPVVAPDVRTSSLLIDGENALLYEAEDMGGAVDAIARLRECRSLRQDLGRRGRRSAERHDWSATAATLLSWQADRA